MTCTAAPVGASALEISSQTITSLHLPPSIDRIIRVVHCCQFLGRQVWRLEIRSANLGAYVAGVFLNEHFGRNELVRVAAQVVLVARIFLSILEDSGSLVRSLCAFRESVKAPRADAVPMTVERLHQEEWASREGASIPSLFFSWPISFIARYVVLPLARVVEVARQIWRLSLRLFELYDALQMGAHSHSSAVDDLFIELGELSGQIGGRERRLAEAMASHGLWINSLLHTLRVPWSVDRVVAALNSIAAGSDTVREACAPATFVVGKVASGVCSVSSALVCPSITQTPAQQRL